MSRFIERLLLSGRERPLAKEELQTVLRKAKCQMQKTSEYVASDRGNCVSFTYKFIFETLARKRQFLLQVASYPPQEWESWTTPDGTPCVRWMDGINQIRWVDEANNLHQEYLVDAQCLIPQDQVGRFRYKFEHFVAKYLVAEAE